MKQIRSGSFLPFCLALVAVSAVSLPSSTALTTTPTTPGSAIRSSLFRSRRHPTGIPSAARPFVSLQAAASLSAQPESDSSRDVQTVLPGILWKFCKEKYVVDFDWTVDKGMSLWKKLVGALQFFFLGGLVKTLFLLYANKVRKIPITVYNARAKEAQEGLSKAAFFEKYGFVLLEAPSSMTAEDWEASDRDQAGLLKDIGARAVDGGAAWEDRMDAFRNADTPAKRKYAPEAQQLIQQLVPRAKSILPPAKGIRRNIKGGLYNAPATIVHNDYGLVFDEVVENPFFDFAKQRALYEAENADEYLLVNLWRPIRPMTEPLRSLPLCFLDASTLQKEDFVVLDNKSLGVTTSLKANPDHKFYYYPDMTVDEVVVFKQFHHLRNETMARMPVFHTAFPDPAADATTEGRVSFEYRVGILA